MAKILVAGIDMAGIDGVCGTLNASGHDTITAANGLDVLEMTATEAPDIVLLEIALPTFDAYEVCKMLRGDPDIPQNLPIIILATEKISARRLEEVDATDQIPKNHSSVQLNDLMIKHLGEKAGI